VALGRAPEPSKRLRSIKLPISEIDYDWYRSYPTRRGAIYFGRNRADRLDGNPPRRHRGLKPILSVPLSGTT
jgi:hypothetical protein